MSNRVLQGSKHVGSTPAIILENPKYRANLGSIIRAASCYGVRQVWFSGKRISFEEDERIPREERLKGYKDVELIQYDRPFDRFGYDVTPVALEIDPTAQMLTDYEHPEKAVYVFGPEDGSMSRSFKKECHAIITIPSFHCLNLAGAVYTVLYDRSVKRQRAGQDPYLLAHNMLKEERGVAV